MLEDGFLDLLIEKHISVFREKYSKEYKVILEYNKFIFKILDALTKKGFNQQNGYIMAALVEIHKFYQSTVILFERGLSEPANSLIRTIIDSSIRIVEVIRRADSVDVLLLNTDYENKRTLEFLHNKNLFTMLPKEELGEMLEEKNKDIKDKKDPKIKIKKLAEDNNLLDIYTLFRFQSDYTHQSTDIIGRVIKETDNGYEINEDFLLENFKFEVSILLVSIERIIDILLQEYVNNPELNEEHKLIAKNFEEAFCDLL